MMCKVLYRLRHKQYCPTKEDLNNKELKALANRLKTNSKEKTLINILEWQSKNIKFWNERWVPSVIAIILSIIFFVIFFVLPIFNKWLLLALSLLAFFLLIFLLFLTNNSLIYYGCWIFITSALIFRCYKIWPNLYLLLIVGIVVSLLVLIITIFLSNYIIHNRSAAFDAFNPNLSVEKILKHKLGVCKDYAKLTAALLLTIYKDSEVYFVSTLTHVATGIKINGKIYTLDPPSPILPLDKWITNIKTKICFIKINLGNENINCKFVENLKSLPSQKLSDIRKLSNKVKSLFKIKAKRPIRNPDLEIPIIKTNLLADDLLFQDSLLELIKNKVEDELITNVTKLEYINLGVKDNRLKLDVWLRSE